MTVWFVLLGAAVLLSAMLLRFVGNRVTAGPPLFGKGVRRSPLHPGTMPAAETVDHVERPREALPQRRYRPARLVAWSLTSCEEASEAGGDHGHDRDGHGMGE